MAARKKASRKSARGVAKKGKASASATVRKRKTTAARPSRSAAKSKAARTVKAKSTKSATARRVGAAAKTTRAAKTADGSAKARLARVAARPLNETTAKAGKAAEMNLQSGGNQTKETLRPVNAPATGGAEAKTPREAHAPTPTKPAAAPLAKRAPIAAKAPKTAAEAAPERHEEPAAPKPAKTPSQRQGFKLNEFIVYPAHGVGQIVAVEDQEVAGFHLELFVINFAKDKMTLRVPTAKVVGVGMRKLSEPDAAKRSLEILTGRARIKRTMWSRRAQEYEAKINSGDINAIAEVVRDLYRSDAQPEQSYSERQLYEAALDRMTREIAAVQKLSEIEAMKVIETQLKKSQRRSGKAEAADGDDAAIEEAA